MSTLDELLSKAAEMHGGRSCPGQVLGVRMAMLGCRLLGIETPVQGKDLLVYVEIDRCVADAIAVVTGCRLGKRTLRHMDYGKCACAFVDRITGRAVRIVAREDARDRVKEYVPDHLSKTEAQREAYRCMPDEVLFCIQEVEISIPPHDLPGPPVSRLLCDQCGEGINDRREVLQNGRVLCRSCAKGGYYRKKAESGLDLHSLVRREEKLSQRIP